MNSVIEWQGELTNYCECEDYDELTDTWYASESGCHSLGCSTYDDAMNALDEVIYEWWHANSHGVFFANGIPVWNRQYERIFYADGVADLIQAVTVKGEWRLKYRLDNEILHLMLFHHDVPTGKVFTVTYMNEGDK